MFKDWKENTLINDSTMYKDGAHLTNSGTTCFTSRVASELKMKL